MGQKNNLGTEEILCHVGSKIVNISDINLEIIHINYVFNRMFMMNWLKANLHASKSQRGWSSSAELQKNVLWKQDCNIRINFLEIYKIPSGG